MKDLWNLKFKPMLLDEIDKPFDSKDYIYEMKYDGIRALIFADPKEIRIITRNNNDVTYLYPELKSICKLVKVKTIFDGEIICVYDGKPSFSKLQERSHLKSKEKIYKQIDNNPVIYICFDILFQDKDLINLDLLSRKKILEKHKNNDYFIITKYISEKGTSLFKEIKKLDIEGIVAKKKDSIYEINTRNSSWIKIKNFKEKTFFIGGFSYKKDSYVFSVILGEYIDDLLSFVGKAFISKKNKLFIQLKKQRQIKSQFVNYKEENIIYVKPIYKCKIKFMERTNFNHLRQPFYSGSEDE